MENRVTKVCFIAWDFIQTWREEVKDGVTFSLWGDNQASIHNYIYTRCGTVWNGGKIQPTRGLLNKIIATETPCSCKKVDIKLYEPTLKGIYDILQNEKKKSTVSIFGYRYLEKHTIQLAVVNVKEVYKGTLTCTFYSLYFYSREFFLRQNIQHLKWTKSKISIFKNQRISRSVSLFFLKAIFLLSLTCKCTYLHLFGCPVSPKSSLDFLLCFPKPVQSWAAQGQINKSAAEVIASGKKRTLSLRKQPKPSAGRKKHLGGRRKTTKSIDEDTERTERQLGVQTSKTTLFWLLQQGGRGLLLPGAESPVQCQRRLCTFHQQPLSWGCEQ